MWILFFNPSSVSLVDVGPVVALAEIRIVLVTGSVLDFVQDVIRQIAPVIVHIQNDGRLIRSRAAASIATKFSKRLHHLLYFNFKLCTKEESNIALSPVATRKFLGDAVDFWLRIRIVEPCFEI